MSLMKWLKIVINSNTEQHKNNKADINCSKNMKKIITESQLRDIIAESVKKCISELSGYHPTPNTDNNAWRGQKRGEGDVDKNEYSIYKPFQTPKPIGNQKAAPSNDRMKKMNEGLFGPSKKEKAQREKERQKRIAQYQAEVDAQAKQWNSEQKSRFPNERELYTDDEWAEREQRLARNAEQQRWNDRERAAKQRQADAEDEAYRNKLRAFKPEPYYKVYDRLGKYVWNSSDERAAQNYAHSIGGTYELAYTKFNG